MRSGPAESGDLNHECTDVLVATLGRGLKDPATSRLCDRHRQRRWVPRGRRIRTVVVGVALVAGGCVARLPVVTDPAYPDYLFPTVPARFGQSDVTQGHEEAWIYLQSGDLVTARARYTALLHEAPEFYPAAAALGWVSFAQGEPEEAAKYFARATAAEPAYVAALVGYGEVMVGLGRSEEALSSFEAALAADPKLPNLSRSVDQLRFTVVSDRLSAARRAAEAGRFAEATDGYQRLIAASPDSGFLHVELGRVEQQLGNPSVAMEHAREAARLDPADALAFLLEGEIHEASGDLDSALAAYETANDVDPTDVTAGHVERVRHMMFLAALPSEVGEIPTKDSVTRGDLAALIGVRFTDTLGGVSDRPVIITDTRDHWGSQWIQAVADAGVMDVDAAYRFDPSRSVRRGDLAEVVMEMLDLLERETGVAAVASDAASRTFSDMSGTHLRYEAARLAVGAGILDALEGNRFQPSRLVTGAEAVEAVARLAALALDT